jgi:DNA-binding phage protein
MKKIRRFNNIAYNLKDPEEAKAYIAAITKQYDEDKDYDAYMLALVEAVEAQKGTSKVVFTIP